MSRKEIIYLVLNALSGGGQAVTNHPFSEQQIGDEIDLLRLDLLRRSKEVIDYTRYYQLLDCVQVGYVENPSCFSHFPVSEVVLRTKDRMPAFFVPTGKKLVHYIGSADWMQPYHLVSSDAFPYSRYKKYTFPEAIYRDGYFYLAHVPSNLSRIGIQAIFEQPHLVTSQFPCCEDKAYPIPGEYIPILVNRLVEIYKTHGSFLLPQPNTQSYQSPVVSQK